jgi:hypothetical protein
MEPNEKVEKVFSDTPAPCVTQGNHRTRLKVEIAATMRRKETRIMNRQRRLVWVCVTLFLLAATAWAGTALVQKIFTVRHETVAFDGANTIVTTKEGMLSTGSACTQEQADAQYREIQGLIAQGKYELVKVVELPDGTKDYTYRLVLSSGEEVKYGARHALGDDTGKP